MAMRVIQLSVILHAPRVVGDLAVGLDVPSLLNQGCLKANLGFGLDHQSVGFNLDQPTALHVNVVALIGIQRHFAILDHDPITPVLTGYDNRVFAVTTNRNRDKFSAR